MVIIPFVIPFFIIIIVVEPNNDGDNDEEEEDYVNHDGANNDYDDNDEEEEDDVDDVSHDGENDENLPPFRPLTPPPPYGVQIEPSPPQLMRENGNRLPPHAYNISRNFEMADRGRRPLQGIASHHHHHRFRKQINFPAHP